jgi:hypothetical protein
LLFALIGVVELILSQMPLQALDCSEGLDVTDQPKEYA